MAAPRLGFIHGGNDVPWQARCSRCSWTSGPGRHLLTSTPSQGMIKRKAIRLARQHLAAEPNHVVYLEAVTWQVVFGDQVGDQ